jgi:hypothetical protein
MRRNMATNKKSPGGKGKRPRLPTPEEKRKVIRTLDTILKENEELELHVKQVKDILEDLDYIDI